MVRVEEKRQEEMEEAFSEMVETYSDLAYNVAYRMLNNAEDARDAVQEAFISAYRAFSSFKGQSKLSTWLYRIVVNACLMKLRKERSRVNRLVLTGYEDVVIPDWSNDPEDAVINSELGEVLERGLSQLSPELRAAVVLRDAHGLSSGEAAEALGIAVPALKSRLHRGRILLRKHLEGYIARPSSGSQPSPRDGRRPS